MNELVERGEQTRYALETEALGKVYKTERGSELKVLEDINIRISEGEFVTVIGPSGCGKTTLLEILAGLRKASSGRLRVYGREEDFPTAEKGVVFQKDAVFPWLTVSNNVMYGLNLKKMERAAKLARVESFIRMVGLSGYEKYYPKELSGGMRKRLAIAMVFANDPRILFMDEPFGSLDYYTKIELQNQLLDIWEKNQKTVFFVTHDLEEALFLSSRIIIIRNHTSFKEHIVPFARPRGLDLRLQDDFRHEIRRLWGFIQ
jgi:NitT/TauT family transport system ATP-binding protein